jgi:hypothetical protein
MPFSAVSSEMRGPPAPAPAGAAVGLPERAGPTASAAFSPAQQVGSRQQALRMGNLRDAGALQRQPLQA